MENVMLEMDFEIWLEFDKEKITEERNIDTNVGRRNFYGRFRELRAAKFKWCMESLYWRRGWWIKIVEARLGRALKVTIRSKNRIKGIAKGGGPFKFN